MYIYDSLLEHSSNHNHDRLSSQHYLQKLEENQQNGSLDNKFKECLLECANAMLWECLEYNVSTYTNIKLQELMKMTSSNDISAIINCSIHRLELLKAYIENNWNVIIQRSTSMVANWPKIQDFYIPGLTDVLIMLSHAYHNKGMYEDGIHAIRLGIQISHEGLNMMQNYQPKKFSLKSLFLGPLLTIHEALVTSYHCIATQLRYVEAVDLTFSTEWHDRCINRCINFSINVLIINLFCEVWHRQNAITAQKYYHIPSIPSEVFVSIHQDDSIQDQVVYDNIETTTKATTVIDELKETIDVESIHTSSGKWKRPNSANIDSVFRDDILLTRRPKSASSMLESNPSNESFLLIKENTNPNLLEINYEQNDQISSNSGAPVKQSSVLKFEGHLEQQQQQLQQHEQQNEQQHEQQHEQQDEQQQGSAKSCNNNNNNNNNDNNNPLGKILGVFRKSWRKPTDVPIVPIVSIVPIVPIIPVHSQKANNEEEIIKKSNGPREDIAIHTINADEELIKKSDDAREDISIHTSSSSSSSGKSKRPYSANLTEVESSLREASLPTRNRPRSASSKFESPIPLSKLENQQPLSIPKFVERDIADIGKYNANIVELEEDVEYLPMSSTYQKHVEFTRQLQTSIDKSQNKKQIDGAGLSVESLSHNNTKRVNNDDCSDEVSELNRLLLTIRNNKAVIKKKKPDSETKHDFSQSKRFAKQFRLKSHVDMHKSCQKILKLLVSKKNNVNEKRNLPAAQRVNSGRNSEKEVSDKDEEEINAHMQTILDAVRNNDRIKSSDSKRDAENYDTEINNNEVACTCDEEEIGNRDKKVDINIMQAERRDDMEEENAKGILATFIHAQMDDIENAIEVLKLGVAISSQKCDHDSFVVNEDSIKNFDYAFARIRFLNDFELDADMKHALTMKIDSTHDELVYGCTDIINLVGALSLLLICIKSKFNSKPTVLELRNEIEKLKKTTAGETVFSIYDLGI